MARKRNFVAHCSAVCREENGKAIADETKCPSAGFSRIGNRGMLCFYGGHHQVDVFIVGSASALFISPPAIGIIDRGILREHHNTMRYQLLVEPDGGESFHYPLPDDGNLVIGRAKDVDLSIEDRALSRRHARLFFENGHWMVEDLGSQNGTWLDRTPVTKPTRVQPGRPVRLSYSTLTLEKLVQTSAHAFPDHDLAEGTLFRNALDLLELENDSLAPEKVAQQPSGENAAISRLKMINEVHEALGTSISFENLLDLILDKITTYLKPEQAAIVLKDKDGQYQRAATRAVSNMDLDPRFLCSRSLIREVAEKGQAALVFDAEADSRFSAAESIVSSGIRSLLAAPLLGPDGSLGMIALGTRAHVKLYSEEDMALLVSLASIAALRIHNLALTEEAAERRHLEEELALARRIQVALLPDKLPAIPGYAVLGHNVPSKGVSGDFYQVIARKNGDEYVFVIVDVSGKGMAASLLTASLEALSAAPIEDGLSSQAICTKLSRMLHNRTPPEKYATMFLGILTPATGQVQFTNAGHNPAVLLRTNGEHESIAANAPPIGILADVAFEEHSFLLNPGDTLLLYTDGLTEATNPQDDMYGMERLITAAKQAQRDTLEQLANHLEQDLEKFVDNEPFADDRTLVMLRRAG